MTLRRKVGLLFQRPNLFSWASGGGEGPAQGAVPAFQRSTAVAVPGRALVEHGDTKQVFEHRRTTVARIRVRVV
jgi:hypothetical protein